MSATKYWERIPEEVRGDRSECDCMNALQNHGVISAECIDWVDVAIADQEDAIEWLKRHPDEK